MTLEEIFIQLNTQMYKGILMHSDMRQIYQFLGLYGYAQCQEYHYLEEINNQSSLQQYYLSHYFKLLKIGDMQHEELVPASWYKYSSQDVDIGTKRNTIKELMTKWINWEKETKQLYESLYIELIGITEVAAALYLIKIIEDVSEELSQAQKMLLDLEAIGFNLENIIDWQPSLQKNYIKLGR